MSWMTTRRSRVGGHAAAIVYSFAIFLADAAGLCGTVEEEAAKLLEQAEKSKDIPDLVRQLESLGPGAAPVLKKAWQSTAERERLVAAAAGAASDPQAAGRTLLGLLDSSDREVAAAAAQCLSKIEDDAIEFEMVKRVRATSSDPFVRIPLARSLWEIASSDQSRFVANGSLRLLLDHSDKKVVEAAVLALAEIGDFAEPVPKTLREMSSEHSLTGRLAKALLEKNLIRERYLQDLSRDKTLRTAVINEVEDLIRRFHIYQPLADDVITNFAARGIVSALAYTSDDKFSSYYDPQEWNAFKEQMSKTYAGIGARVQFLDFNGKKFFTITEPIYGGPADKAGLRRYDRILEIDGQPTEKADPRDLVPRLKGKENTKVELLVARTSWDKPRKITLTREAITLPSVAVNMLPGRIAYLRLESFSENAVEEIVQALESLEKQKPEGIVFDLRNNPGGYLEAAHRVADLFLPGESLIVYSLGRNPQVAARKDYLAQKGTYHSVRAGDTIQSIAQAFGADAAEVAAANRIPQDQALKPGTLLFVPGKKDTQTDLPMVVLVNRHSASASEIVAGALKFYKRCILVGRKTYGKGSVQQLYPLRSLGNTAALKLTVAKYYLPDGKCIHGEGVEPNVNIEAAAFPYDLFESLRAKGAFDRYSHELVEKDIDLYKKLATFDGFDATKYPGFDDWYKTVQDEVTRDVARRLLRFWLRGIVSDFLKTDLTGEPPDNPSGEESAQVYMGNPPDFEEDTQLQRALLELARAVPSLKQDFPAEYRLIFTLSKMKELSTEYEKLFGPKPSEK